MSPLEDSVSVLAAANAGLGSKKDQDWSALLKSQTRTRLSLLAITSANTVSVSSVVTTGTAAAAVTVKLVVAVTDPAVASNAWEPVPICGTKAFAVNVPSTSVDGAGDGRAETVAMFKDVKDTNPGKPLPVTVMVSPIAALVGDTVIVAADTL